MWHILKTFLTRHLPRDGMDLVRLFETHWYDAIGTYTAFLDAVTFIVKHYIVDPDILESWKTNLANTIIEYNTDSTVETVAALEWLRFYINRPPPDVVETYEMIETLRTSVSDYYSTRDIIRTVLYMRTHAIPSDRHDIFIQLLNDDAFTGDNYAIDWYRTYLHDVSWIMWSYKPIVEFCQSNRIDFDDTTTPRQFNAIKSLGMSMLKGKELKRFERCSRLYLSDKKAV